MNPPFIFKPSAMEEFAKAIAWYEKKQPGLGKEFAQEVYQALERAFSQPEIFCKVRGRARKIRLKRFKSYGIYFAIKDDAFSVMSVFHGSQNPAKLRRRLE